MISHLLNTQQAFAQADCILANDKEITLKNIATLPDKNYSFEQILKDTTLHFIKAEKIPVKDIDYYWLKFTVKNPSAYDEKYAVWPRLPFENTLYWYDEDAAKWKSLPGGEMVNNNRTVFKFIPCMFKGGAATTVYIKMKVAAINTSPCPLVNHVRIEPLSIIQARMHSTYNMWLATILIVLAFFIYNAYLYFMFKDKVYLYYLLLLFGGLIYITASNYFLNYFTKYHHVSVKWLANGGITYLPFDLIVQQLAIILVMTGFVQLARAYLQTKERLLRWDKILKYSLLVFCTYTGAISVALFVNLLSPGYSHSLSINIFTLFLLILILMVGVIAYRKNIKQARYFLAAMSLPLLIVLALVVYLMFNDDNFIDHQLLHNIAIVTQTLTFAIALVARVNIIKNDLHIKNLENQQIAREMAVEKERTVRLEEKIEFDKKDIAAAKQIKLLMKELHHRVKNNLQIVSSLLSLQSFRIKDKIAADAVKEGQHRIEAMSLIHQRLYTNDNITEVNIKEFVTDISESLMQAYGYDNNNFVLNLKIENELMDVDKAIPLSLIINELVTNAFKYAYADTAKPTLNINLTKVQNDMQLFIADNGKGMDMEAWQNNEGYGKELVKTFTKQLDGEITVRIDNGTMFKITFPTILHNN